jgi:hypothetical protein
MKNLVIGLLLSALLGCSSKDLDELKALGYAPLTRAEVTQALKDALSRGVARGVGVASASDGYFANPRLRIELPDEAAKMETTLRKLGFAAEVDKAVLQINRAAEEAASRARPIFIKAITEMTIYGAFDILNGEQDAATRYLRSSTYDQLYEQFRPVIAEALEETAATRYYGDIVRQYNAMPFTSNIDPDLAGHVTERAIDGLFVLIAEEEARIRSNPAARSTRLLQRVFGSLD